MRARRTAGLALIGLTALADLMLFLPGLRHSGAFLLLWVAPGLAWALLLSPGQPGAEEIATGLGLGMATGALLTLILSYLPGPLVTWALAMSMHPLIVAAALKRWEAEETMPEGLRAGWAALAVLLLVSTPLRLVNLNYSEFQGDEGVIMVRAAALLQGDSGQLFLHQKGPMEMLLPAATWALSGTIDEGLARLPFALAGVLGVAAVFLLGRRVAGRRAGLLGGLLLAINGYFVAFGRIVQYQSVVLAMTALGLLALWRWSQREGDRWLVAGAALLACGLLAHYDAVLAFPAALAIVARRWWAERVSLRSHLLSLLIALAVALAVLALFYAPFARHPNFAKTLAYLRTERMGTGEPVHNNLSTTLPLTTLYNSTYYAIFLALLLLAAGFRPFRRWWTVLPALCAAALLGATIVESRAGPYLALAASGLWLATLIAARETSLGERVLWLWFAAPFLFHYFLVWDPRTHVLNAFPAASLLAALPLSALWERLRRPTARRGLAALALALYGLLGYYVWMTFVDHTPETQRSWPLHRSPLYWTPYETLPRFGLFGFPYRAGWKAVGQRMAEGELGRVYASNEEEEVTRWYTRGAERTYCPGPDFYAMAALVQDEMPVARAEVRRIYHLTDVVRAGGKPKLWIYEPGPAISGPSVHEVEEYERAFDAQTTPAAVLPAAPADIVPSGAVLGGQIRLIGYRLDAEDAYPGGELRLTLYWEPLVPLRSGYQVFTHLYNGVIWGQHDSTPGCGLWPTTRWEPGRWVRDDHVLPIDGAAPPEAMPLLVGMYDLQSGERLAVTGPDGELAGDAILLATVALR